GGLSWHTVRRAELSAIERWERTTPRPALTMIGVDEKWLGRRHKRKEKFVTIVSDLATGVPVWIGYGRDSETLKGWLDSLAPEQKPAIRLFATDMHEPFKKAIRDDPALAHTALVHDPFHVIKRAGEAVTEQRRAVFFRAGPELRAIGKGTFASGTTRSSVQCLTRDDRDADGAVMIDPRISSMGVAIRRSRRVAFTVERENSGMPSGPVS